jgi:pantothenate kinase-related protein Tda10
LTQNGGKKIIPFLEKPKKAPPKRKVQDTMLGSRKTFLSEMILKMLIFLRKKNHWYSISDFFFPKNSRFRLGREKLSSVKRALYHTISDPPIFA